MPVALNTASGHFGSLKVLFKTRIAGRALAAKQPETAKHVRRGTDRGHPFLRIIREFLQFPRENRILTEVLRARPPARQDSISA